MKITELLELSLSALKEVKGRDISCLKVSELTDFTDIMLIVTGNTIRQVRALADSLVVSAKKNGVEIYKTEPLIACEKIEKKQLGQHPIKTPYKLPEKKEEKLNCSAPRVIDKQNRFLMYSMLQDVIKRGTGRKARTLGRKDIAGKTGTTNEQRDAWFNGFNQSIVTNVWVGFDSNEKLGKGEVGGRAALPAWIDFMRVILKGEKDLSPEMPEGLVSVKIDPITGKRSSTDTKDPIFEVFREEFIPDKSTTKPKVPGTENKSNSEVIELF